MSKIKVSKPDSLMIKMIYDTFVKMAKYRYQVGEFGTLRRKPEIAAKIQSILGEFKVDVYNLESRGTELYKWSTDDLIYQCRRTVNYVSHDEVFDQVCKDNTWQTYRKIPSDGWIQTLDAMDNDFRDFIELENLQLYKPGANPYSNKTDRDDLKEITVDLWNTYIPERPVANREELKLAVKKMSNEEKMILEDNL